MSNEIEHIAFIMDGNRRFAKRLMQKPWKGHEWGAKKVREVLRWCRDAGVRYVTLYSLSIENLQKRPKQELDMLMRIFKKEFEAIPNDDEIHENEVRINVIGRVHLLPKEVRDAIARAVEATQHYNKYVVNFAIAYGGRSEIVDGVRKVMVDFASGKIGSDELDEERFRHYLYTNGTPDPDLIIRTGGERRLSGFLLWQAAYAELYFTNTLWPEFSREEFQAALKDFFHRERRFGR